MNPVFMVWQIICNNYYLAKMFLTRLSWNVSLSNYSDKR